MPGDEPPVWKDPLLQRLEPTGTGSGAYVEQPPPRANPMTVEGEIAAFGEMARGFARKSGRSGWMVRGFIAIAVLAFAAALVSQVVNVFR